MTVTVKILDKGTGGQDMGEWSLELPCEKITVRELIKSRVYQEVEDYNAKMPSYFRGLIQPTDAERTLNGYRMKPGRTIEWKEQYDRAIVGFENNMILVLVGNHQVEKLDEEVIVDNCTKVTFLRLVWLAGG